MCMRDALTGLLMLPAAVSGDDSKAPVRLSSAEMRLFPGALLGAWRGEAVLTPVGLRPYAMTFEGKGEGCSYGAANPGAAIHHWTFCPRDDHVSLRFLTTFRGNQRPVLLSARTRGTGGLVFSSQERPELEVRVDPGQQATKIRVYLSGQPHVEIHLKR